MDHAAIRERGKDVAAGWLINQWAYRLGKSRRILSGGPVMIDMGDLKVEITDFMIADHYARCEYTLHYGNWEWMSVYGF